MKSDQITTLIKLSDSEQILADPDADIRGRAVRDRNGEDLGKVDDLLIDRDEHKVRMLRVEHGGFLGIGATPSFIPVDAVTAVTNEVVYVDTTKETVAGAPRYDPQTVQEPDYGSLYGYYGYAPYWAPGYVYPGYPHYR